MLNQSKPVDCYFEPTDSISSFELVNSNSTFIGGVYLMCDKGHVLKYYRGPHGSIEPDAVSTTIERLKDKYPMFFKSNIPADVMEHYFYAISFITTEYWAGAAYSIRTLLERLIYDNYGPYFFSGNSYLNFKTDKDELKKIYSRIGNIGFQLFVDTILSESTKEEIKKVNDEIKKGKKPDTNRGIKIGKNLNDLMIMINKIEDDPANEIILDQNQYQEFQSQYNVLSEGLHPRTPIGSPEIDKALNVVLNGYQSYFNKNNTWRVKYD